MSLAGNWSFPTSVRFGAGRIAELGEAAKSAGMARPLLVTDRRLSAMAPCDRALAVLQANGIAAAVFADIRPNPVAATIAAGLEALRAGAHDGVIAHVASWISV